MNKVAQAKINLDPTKVPPSQVINTLRQMPGQLASVPATVGQVPQSQRIPYINDAANAMEAVDKTLNAEMPLVQNIEEAEHSTPHSPPIAEQYIQTGSYFDLFKTSQGVPQIPTAVGEEMAMGDPTAISAPAGEPSPNSGMQSSVLPPKFKGFQNLRQYLDAAQDPVAVSQAFRKTIGNDISKKVTDGVTDTSIDPQSAISDMVVRYIEGRDTLGNDEKDSMAEEIYSLLPDNLKENAQPGLGEGQVPTHNERVASIVSETDVLIQKIAKSLVKSHKIARASGFNMKKFAQHKGLEQTMMFGPGQTAIDAFTGQLISKWHLVERNKGFGLRVDDVLDIDWESIWRSTIMDKYSQPYRNKDGEWVGGYLNKRFEVARNIPEGNNLQLKPGQLRRPYLPEFSSTEARLESMREKSAKERGYKPVSEGKPFNWKEASKKKVT